MIRMIQSNSPAHAKAYFVEALSKSDYYVNDQELAGGWQGLLAERIGVGGLVSKDDFFAMCDNLHPLTKEPLTPITRDNRRTGYDINFHAPKSVSILHALSKDDHILKAFQESVTETMQHIEQDAMTRVRKDHVYDDRKTGELAWAHFVHQTARPVDGHLPDPHLHSHCFVFNATWDEVEKQFKAGQFGDIKRDMPYYQARFHKALSDRLMALGYQVRLTDKSFELEGVPQKVLDLFSKRTDEIGRIAKEKGITDAKELSELGARTRAKKQKGVSMDALKEAWKSQIETLGVEKVEGAKAVRFALFPDTPTISSQDCVNHALLHCFERASVMADRRILETAFRHSLGTKAKAQDIADNFKADKRIIHVTEKGRTLCTTKEVLAEEKRMVELAKAGQGKMRPLYDKPPELALKGQQADAAIHVLTTTHRVSIIRGAAGAGKTTLMKETVEKIKQAGKEVITVAPSADASRGVLRGEGFGNAETVAKFLTDPKMQEKAKGQVIWVDEAGLLGTKDMTALLDVATKNNARLILGGDTRQHASVVRGDALRILNTVAGIRTAEVSKIYRQKNEDYKKAVEYLSKGDIEQGFKKLDEIKAIKAVDPMNPNQALVEDYIQVVKKGKEALVISPTHAQGEAVTKAIRDRLRQEGYLGKKEIAITRLVNLNFTEAEKSDARNFEAGHVVQFNQNAKGFERGSAWVVDSSNEKTVTVKNDAGEKKTLPLENANRFDVYRQTEIHLSKGDKIRITKNGFDVMDGRLDNGTVLEVVSVSKKGEVVLQNPKSKVLYTLNKDFGHLSHAHCITSYASQGKTVDAVFIYQPASTFPATDAKQFYVSVSRGKETAHIYTDDKEALLQHAAEMRERQSAIELVKKDKSKEQIDRLQKQSPQTQKPQPKPVKQKESYEPEI